MDEPTFLIVYAAVIAAVLGWCVWRNRLRVGPAVAAGPPLSDPYQAAWLRGGVDEVIRLAVYDASRRDLLTLSEVRGDRMLQAVAGAEAAGDLHPFVAELLRHTREPVAIRQLLSPRLQAATREHFRDCERRLMEDGLITSPGQRGAAWRTVVIGIGLILLVGGLRLESAVQHDPLVIICALIGSGLALVFARPRRLTPHGYRELDRLRRSYDTKPDAPTPATSGFDDPVLLGVALFGYAMLSGTPYGHLQGAFQSHDTGSGGDTGGDWDGGGSGDGGGGGE